MLVFSDFFLFSEIVSLLSWGVCIAFLLFFMRYGGEFGLVVYIAISVVLANIQVLKLVSYHFLPDLVACGTILFATTNLAVDLLAEYYGPKAARRAIHLSLGSLCFVALSMEMVLALPQGGTSMDMAVQRHEALSVVFSPAPALFFASLVAYALSQYSDVYIFSLIFKVTKSRWLWLRANVATGCAAILDTIVFSVLAWIILASQPLPWEVVWKSYIWGALLIRLLLSFLSTPVMYIAKRCLKEVP